MILALALAAALFAGAADPTPPQAPVVPPPAEPAPTAPNVVVSSSQFKNPSDQVKTAADANKVVCRSEASTGSRLGAMRVCMTNAQWAERAARDRQVVEESQGRSYTH